MTDEESQTGKQVNINIEGISDVSGQLNVAGGDIYHIGANSTVIMAAPAEAVSGLIALRDLMQRSSDVRTAVIEFQTDFKLAREQLDQVGDYKDLHDLLHSLQIHCYDCILRIRIRFPVDELILSMLDDYTMTLEELVEKMKEVATRPSLSKQDLSWIDDADLAGKELRNALVTLEEKPFKMAIWRLNRLLTTHPARINIMLNHSVRALRLPALLSDLKLISDTLSLLDLDHDKMMTFQSGVVAFGELDRHLSLLVNAHDHWQKLDIELRRIEAFIDRDISELELSWPDVKLMAVHLYIDRPDEWAKALKKEGEILGETLNSSNPARLRECFRRYQRRVIQRFYQVDVELKLFSGQMRQIGIPLAFVLELIA